MQVKILETIDGKQANRRGVYKDKATFLFNHIRDNTSFSFYLTNYGRWVVQNADDNWRGYSTIQDLILSDLLRDNNGYGYGVILATLFYVSTTEKEDRTRLKACEQLRQALEKEESNEQATADCGR